MHLPYRERRQRLDVELTPMIDVVFQLLIFFICTATFQIPERHVTASMAPPENESSASPVDQGVSDAPPQVVVKLRLVDGQLQWHVQKRVCTQWDETRAALETLAQIDPEIPVIIDPDDDVTMQDVIALRDLCEQARFRHFAFAARRVEP
jgi:biopolymer transport protein ExbD